MNQSEKKVLIIQVINFIINDATNNYEQLKTLFDTNNLSYIDRIKCDLGNPGIESYTILKKKCYRCISLSAINSNTISYEVRDDILNIINS